jgi:RNA polymerase sigma factor (sigma-70 family)
MVNGDKIKNNDFFLWKRFLNGDQKALEEIYKSNYQALYNYGLRIHSDPDLVKDTIQELFFDLINSLQNLGETDNIRFYLIVSFRRKMMLALKKKGNVVLPGITQFFDFDFDVSVEDAIINNEEKSSTRLKLRKIINNLSSRQKEAVFLKFFYGLTYEQITKVMGINYQSARSIIYKAIRIMREVFEEKKYAEKVRIH